MKHTFLTFTLTALLFLIAGLAIMQEAHDVAIVALVIIPVVLLLGFVLSSLPNILAATSKNITMAAQIKNILSVNLSTCSNEQSPEKDKPSKTEPSN